MTGLTIMTKIANGGGMEKERQMKKSHSMVMMVVFSLLKNGMKIHGSKTTSGINPTMTVTLSACISQRKVTKLATHITESIPLSGNLHQVDHGSGMTVEMKW